MKEKTGILIMIVVFLILCPGVARAELSPEDLLAFQTSLSSIISFFAGNLAVIGFLAGVFGGRI